MSIGTILVGVAIFLVVIAYLAQPFRAARVGGLDERIEFWVARVQVDEESWAEAEEDEEQDGAETEVNFCTQCGRSVRPGDRFCAGCGTPLKGDAG